MRIKKTSQYIEGGAEISNVYGTSTSNGYSQNYINSINNYSTTEIDTGKLWIDGKKIYRISFEFTKSANDQKIMTISNLDVIINAQTYLKRNDNYKNINNFYSDTSDRFTMYAQNNDIRCSSPYMGTLYGTLEYTKTN